MSNETLQTSTRKTTYDLFVSYNHQDTRKVAPILDALRGAKLEIFDPLENPNEMWGRDLNTWFGEIVPSRARAVLVFLSHHYLESKWCQIELAHMLQSTRLNPELAKLLPIRLDETPIPAEANEIVFLDVASKTPNEIAVLTKAKLSEIDESSEGCFETLGDEALLKWIAEERNSEALDVLYKRIYPMLVHSIRGYFHSHPESIKDEALASVVSDVMVKVWEQAARFKNYDSTFETWLSFLTRQCVVDFQRNITKGENAQLERVWEPSDSQMFTKLDISTARLWDTQVLLHNVFESLEDRDRRLLELFMSGMTSQEISEYLGITPSACRMKVHRLIKRLRNSMVHLERK